MLLPGAEALAVIGIVAGNGNDAFGAGESMLTLIAGSEMISKVVEESALPPFVSKARAVSGCVPAVQREEMSQSSSNGAVVSSPTGVPSA